MIGSSPVNPEFEAQSELYHGDNKLHFDVNKDDISLVLRPTSEVGVS
jgi:hypothetical protein